jgi:hypothetical protein
MTAKTHIVKLSAKGKVLIKLEGTCKMYFVQLLEAIMRQLEHYTNQNIDMRTIDGKKNFALMSEIYYNHFVQFNMLHVPCMVSLTMSQALCLWQMAVEYDNDITLNPELGNLLMQIHQKLS